MRYFYEPPPITVPMYGQVHCCNHPLYTYCTLYLEGGIGLAVIQQRFDSVTKHFWWGPIDECLANDIYLSPNFPEYFHSHAAKPTDAGLYFTVPVRSLMWALRMKPLRKEPWEQFSAELTAPKMEGITL